MEGNSEEKLAYKQHKLGLITNSFLIGVSINTGYLLITLSAQDNAHFFKKQNLTAFFGFVLLIFALVATVLIAMLFPTTPHSTKINWSSSIRTLAFLLLSSAFVVKNLDFGFWISIVATILLGMTSIDHIVFVGFLKQLPTYCFTGYSSGVGFSGFLGVVFYLGTKNLKIPLQYTSLMMIPFNIVVLVSFYWIKYIKDSIESGNNLENFDLKILDQKNES